MVKINTMQHLSDEASSITVDTTKTVWKGNASIVTLQDALNTLKPIVVGDVKATNAVYGMVRLAKDTDLEKGVGSKTDVITGDQLIKFNGKPLADYKTYGTARYSTGAETLAGTHETSAVNPKQLEYKLSKTTATTMKNGMVKFSSESMVIPGVNNDTAMTPKLVKMAIDALDTSVAIASESNTGTVILSNVKTTLAGKVREGYAISPFSFVNSNGSLTEFGTVRMASVTEAYDASIKDKYAISPASFQNAKATTAKRGTVHLATEAEVKAKTNADKAITPLSISHYTKMIEDLNKKLNDLLGQDSTVYGVVPVGGMIESFTIPNASTGFVIPDGRKLSKVTYPVLFEAIGYTYGGSGNDFYLPDIRGLYTRSTGKGSNIKGALGNVVGGGSVGTIQEQQIMRHKHAGFGTAGHNDFEPPFGLSSNRRWKGASNSHHGSRAYYTNDGTEDLIGNTSPINLPKLVGNENRPWTMSVYKLIRIK